MNPQAAAEVPAVCASCQQSLGGKFCAQCGEKRLDPNHLTLRHFFMHTVVQEIFNLDGRVWRTLRKLLFRPGFLTLEYCAGRRQPYVNPLRIYIVSIIAYALLTQGGLLATLRMGPVILSVAPASIPEEATVTEAVQRIDRFNLLTNLLADKSQSVDVTSETFRRDFHSRFENFAEPLAFANVLLLAIALYLIFRRRHTLFVQHGVFAMHQMSFVLFSSLLFIPATWLVASYTTLALIDLFAVTIWQFVYLSLAINRFYLSQDGRRVWRYLSAVGIALFIYLLNSAFVTGVQLLGAALAIAG